MAEHFGASLICTNLMLTGRPGRLVHLWQVQKDFSLAALHARVYEDAQENTWLKDMFARLDAVSYDVLFPTSYDPGRCWTAPGANAACTCVDPPVSAPDPTCVEAAAPGATDPGSSTAPAQRLLDVIAVKSGRLADLVNRKRGCFIENARRFGITLVASGTRVTEPRRLVQFWNLPSADALEHAIEEFQDRGWYQDMFSKDVASEQQDLLTPWKGFDPRPKLNGNCWQFGI
jgi:hypothetical protein